MFDSIGQRKREFWIALIRGLKQHASHKIFRGQRKRELWIALILLMPLLSITIGIYAGVSTATRSTPDKTLAAFCNAMQSGNIPRAYGQYSSRYQHTYSKQQFES